MARTLMRLPRFTTLQLLLAAALLALLFGLFTSAWRAGSPSRIVSLCFSPNGQFLAANYSTGAVRVWRLDHGRMRLGARTFREEPDRIWDAIFFSDNRRLIVVESDYPSGGQSVVREIDLMTGKNIARMKLTAGFTLESYLAGRGDRLYVPKWNTNVIECHNLNTQQLDRRLAVGKSPVWTLAISVDGGTLAVISADLTSHPETGDLTVIDTSNDRVINTFYCARPATAVLTSDGARLAYVTSSPQGNNKVMICTPADGCSEELNTSLQRIYWIAMSADGSRLIAAGDGGIFELFDIQANTLLKRIPPVTPADLTLLLESFLPINRVWNSGNTLSPDGKTLASFLQDRVIVQDLSSGKVLYAVGGGSRLLSMAMFLSGFAVWATVWGIVRKRGRQSLANSGPLRVENDSCQRIPTPSAPLALICCWGLMVVGGIVALGIPIVLMFTMGPWLFPTVYFSLFVGLAAIARGAARDTVRLRRTAGLQLANMMGLDPANVVFAAMEFALLRSRSVREYLGAENR